MCGHGTIGVVATLAHLEQDRRRHASDRHARRHRHARRLDPDGEVSVTNVPTLAREAKAVTIEVPGIGAVTGDVAWGGNWFFLIADHGQDSRLPTSKR